METNNMETNNMDSNALYNLKELTAKQIEALLIDALRKASIFQVDKIHPDYVKALVSRGFLSKHKKPNPTKKGFEYLDVWNRNFATKQQELQRELQRLENRRIAASYKGPTQQEIDEDTIEKANQRLAYIEDEDGELVGSSRLPIKTDVKEFVGIVKNLADEHCMEDVPMTLKEFPSCKSLAADFAAQHKDGSWNIMKIGEGIRRELYEIYEGEWVRLQEDMGQDIGFYEEKMRRDISFNHPNQLKWDFMDYSKENNS